jgi:hypothetical protein
VGSQFLDKSAMEVNVIASKERFEFSPVINNQSFQAFIHDSSALIKQVCISSFTASNDIFSVPPPYHISVHMLSELAD